MVLRLLNLASKAYSCSNKQTHPLSSLYAAWDLIQNKVGFTEVHIVCTCKDVVSVSQENMF